MTRQQILEQYTIDRHGTIRSPGKFEGEMLYAPYFYDALMDGDGEEVYAPLPENCSEEEAELWESDDSLLYTTFQVSEKDRLEFPELEPETQYVAVYESESGFVYVKECNLIEDLGNG